MKRRTDEQWLEGRGGQVGGGCMNGHQLASVVLSPLMEKEQWEGKVWGETKRAGLSDTIWGPTQTGFEMQSTL